MITHLYVDTLVSTLQVDLDTDGDVLPAPDIPKDVSASRIGSTLRVVVFRMNADEFSGLFAIVNARVRGISGVVGARADASDAGARVLKLSQIAAADIALNAQSP